MSSLTLIANIVSDPSFKVALLPERCLRRRLNSNQCQRCLGICPSSALSLNDRKIALDESRCSGCMACVTACPQDALVSDYDLDELLRILREGGDVVVSCVRQEQCQVNEVVVPCVGILSKQFLTAIGFGNCRSVTFNVSGCAECCNRDASTVFMADCEESVAALSHCMKVKFVLVHRNGQLKNTMVGRRSYLAKIREMIADAAEKRFTPARKTQNHKKEYGRRVPYKTKLVENLIMDLDADSQECILSLFGNSLSVNEKCTCCPLCKGICPTGAITIKWSEHGKKLAFEMFKCSGCGVCVEFCKSGSLSLERLSPGMVVRKQHFFSRIRKA